MERHLPFIQVQEERECAPTNSKSIEIRCKACGKVLNGKSSSVTEQQDKIVVKGVCGRASCRLFNREQVSEIPKFGFIGDTDDCGYGEG
jgi:hypothetical protein